MKDNIGHKFMVQTRYANISPSPQNSGVVAQPPLELPLPQDAVVIPLARSASLSIPSMDLKSAIEARRTIRAWTACSRW